MNMAILHTADEAFMQGVLDSNHQYHKALIPNLTYIAEGAHIPLTAILSDSRNFIDEDSREMDYLRNINVHMHERDSFGLMFCDIDSSDALRRMEGMAGMFIRNKLNVHVRTMSELDDMVRSEIPVDRHALFLPDFSVGIKAGEWRRDKVYSLLLKRRTKGLQTFVYVADSEGLADDYGDVIANYVSPPNFVATDV